MVGIDPAWPITFGTNMVPALPDGKVLLYGLEHEGRSGHAHYAHLDSRVAVMALLCTGVGSRIRRSACPLYLPVHRPETQGRSRRPPAVTARHRMWWARSGHVAGGEHHLDADAYRGRWRVAELVRRRPQEPPPLPQPPARPSQPHARASSAARRWSGPPCCACGTAAALARARRLGG